MQKIDYLSKSGVKKLKENMINYVETNRCDIITADDINQWFDEISYTGYIQIPKGTNMTIYNELYGFSAVSDQSYTADIKISAIVYNGSLLSPGIKIDSGSGGASHYKNSFEINSVEFSDSAGKLKVRVTLSEGDFDSVEDPSTAQTGLYHDILVYYTISGETDQQIYTYTADVSRDNKLQTPGQYGFELPYGFFYPEPYTVVSVRDENGSTDYECSQYTTVLDGDEKVYLLILPENTSAAPTKFDIRLKHTAL